jgi:oligoendopeptidase F
MLVFIEKYTHRRRVPALDLYAIGPFTCKTFKALVEGAAGTDFTDLDVEKGAMCLRQTHIFQSPFYYIEDGLAQMVAFGIYRNYRQNGQEAIDQYDSFLHLGYSKPLPKPELYATAGVQLDFSKDYMGGIVDFLRGELDRLTN